MGFSKGINPKSPEFRVRDSSHLPRFCERSGTTPVKSGWFKIAMFFMDTRKERCLMICYCYVWHSMMMPKKSPSNPSSRAASQQFTKELRMQMVSDESFSGFTTMKVSRHFVVFQVMINYFYGAKKKSPWKYAFQKETIVFQPSIFRTNC